MALCLRLKSATASAHHTLEQHAWLRALLALQLTAAAYAQQLASLRTIYAALEDALRQHKTHPALAPLAALPWATWQRTPVLTRDLAAWSDGAVTPPVAAAHAYADRLRYLAATAPERLLAHVYARYLGDLHGGQILAARVRALAARLGRPDAAAATAFHDLGDRAEVAARIVALRAAIDAAALSDSQADAVVDEAVQAFERHVPLFDQLWAAADAAPADAPPCRAPA